MMATKDFPREYKCTLGQKIKDELIELVVMIYRANSATDKARHIELVVERIQAIQLIWDCCGRSAATTSVVRSAGASRICSCGPTPNAPKWACDWSSCSGKLYARWLIPSFVSGPRCRP
jgi:hypothetical protein